MPKTRKGVRAGSQAEPKKKGVSPTTIWFRNLPPKRQEEIRARRRKKYVERKSLEYWELTYEDGTKFEYDSISLLMNDIMTPLCEGETITIRYRMREEAK